MWDKKKDSENKDKIEELIKKQSGISQYWKNTKQLPSNSRESPSEGMLTTAAEREAELK